MFEESAANRLSEAFNLEEGIPVFRTALTTNNGRISSNFHLVEEFLHQEFVFNIVIGVDTASKGKVDR